MFTVNVRKRPKCGVPIFVYKIFEVVFLNCQNFSFFLKISKTLKIDKKYFWKFRTHIIFTTLVFWDGVRKKIYGILLSGNFVFMLEFLVIFFWCFESLPPLN